MSRPLVFAFSLAVCLATLPPLASAPAHAGAGLERQRADYRDAVVALRKKDLTRYRQLAAHLADYPLYGYLEYEYLKDHLADTPAPAIQAFLDKTRDAPIGDQLRRQWLRRLAEQGDWQTFLEQYTAEVDDDAELRCHRLRRLIDTLRDPAPLWTEARELWLVGKPQPTACTPVFEAWRKTGQMKGEIVWTRIRLAIEGRNLEFADELGKRYLGADDRVWLKRWLAMHRQPDKELRALNFPVETALARNIVKHGVVRLAYRDPEAAMREWRRLRQAHKFPAEDDHYVTRQLGILAAQDHLPAAVQWLAAVPAEASDDNLRQWRLRAALRAGDWDAAARFLNAAGDKERQEGQWRYWKARVLEQTQRAQEAKPLYAALAGERSYYGFLAADRLDQGYAMQHNRIEPRAEAVDAILARPGIRMAQELFAIGEAAAARRQWAWTTRGMNTRELQAAAVLAYRWGWHDRAILTAARADHFDDLDLRFPLAYREVVEPMARKSRIDTGLVYGVVRQESAFIPDARSRAGALGLMQLMPYTGRLVARDLKLNVSGQSALLKIENNIQLGIGYLRQVLDKTHNNQALAAAAYNAGPHRVVKWTPEKSALDADVWVESIPFSETRDYVKNVMGYAAIYDYRLGQDITPLKSRMPQVAPLVPQ